jgi:hypothetical protein
VSHGLRFRGKLCSAPASLLFFSGELLKWQFPAAAAGEKLALLAGLLRALFPRSALQTIRRNYS